MEPVREIEMSDNHGKVWWSELMTRDVKAALDYYAATCGWTYDEMPMEEGIYYLAKLPGASVPVAGLMDMSGMKNLDHAPAHWFTYFAVDDVEAAARDTAARGGEVLREPFEIPGTGMIAIVKDPSGAAVGLMTPNPM